MFNSYEVQVEAPNGAYLNIVTTAVNEAEARANVGKMLEAIRRNAGADSLRDAVAYSVCRKVEVRVR